MLAGNDHNGHRLEDYQGDRKHSERGIFSDYSSVNSVDQPVGGELAMEHLCQCLGVLMPHAKR